MHFEKFIWTILFKKKKKKKKKNASFPKFWVGRIRANKHLFFLGLMKSPEQTKTLPFWTYLHKFVDNFCLLYC